MLNFASLAAANRTRLELAWHLLDDWSPVDWSNALAGECGECCNETKKWLRYRESDPVLANVCLRNAVEELADVVIYADLLAQRCGVKLEEVLREKFNQVSRDLSVAGKPGAVYI